MKARLVRGCLEFGFGKDEPAQRPFEDVNTERREDERILRSVSAGIPSRAVYSSADRYSVVMSPGAPLMDGIFWVSL